MGKAVLCMMKPFNLVIHFHLLTYKNQTDSSHLFIIVLKSHISMT